MTYQPTPNQPTPNQPLPPAPDKPRDRLARFFRHRAVILTVGLVVGLIVAPNGSPEPEQVAEPATAATSADSPTQTPEPEPEPEPAEITAKDLKVSVRTVEKDCFGSAGCSVTVEPRISVNQEHQEAVAAGGFEVTITYTGDVDGPAIETLYVEEGGTYSRPQTMLDTVSSNDEIEVKVTEVYYD